MIHVTQHCVIKTLRLFITLQALLYSWVDSIIYYFIILLCSHSMLDMFKYIHFNEL